MAHGLCFHLMALSHPEDPHCRVYSIPVSSVEFPVKVLSLQAWTDLKGSLLLNGSDPNTTQAIQSQDNVWPQPPAFSAQGGIELWLFWAPYLIAA